MIQNRMLALIGALAALATFTALPAAFAGEKADKECDGCSSTSAIRQVALPEMNAIVSGKQKAVVIDSRDPFAFKQGHIPGALSVFVDDMAAKRLPKDKNTLLVFYCGGGGCGLAEDAAQKAITLGYKKVAVYKGGWSTWKQTASR